TCGALTSTSILHKPVSIRLVFLGNPVSAKEEVMDNASHGREPDSCHAHVFSSSFPRLYDWTDDRICGEAGINLRLIRVMQHIHHMRATHALRVVKAGLIEAARLQIGDPALRMGGHFLLRSKHDGLRGTGLRAGRLLASGRSVGAKRALVGCMIHTRNAWNIERTPLHAVTATDAVLVDEIDDAVRVLHDRAGRRASFEA